jgi:hypothetical protein
MAICIFFCEVPIQTLSSFFFEVVRTELKALCVLCKRSTTKSHPQPLGF